MLEMPPDLVSTPSVLSEPCAIFLTIFTVCTPTSKRGMCMQLDSTGIPLLCYTLILFNLTNVVH